MKITVPNARPEIKKVVHHVTKKEGGKGAVREVIELILKTQGRWKKNCGGNVMKRFLILIVMMCLTVPAWAQFQDGGDQQFEGFNLEGYDDDGNK